jgi:DNA-binding NarL/FixJ family response regulator
MSLDRMDPCCECEAHQRIYRNEDGWILTSDFEAWMPAEWKRHCDRYATQKLVPEDRRMEIARRHAAGETLGALAREFHIDPRTVSRYCRKYGRAA